MGGRSELFEGEKATGSSANLSFKHDGCIYITGSGTWLAADAGGFSKVDETGAWEGKAEQRTAFDKIYYEKSENIKAVIHTHSFIVSCIHFYSIAKRGYCTGSYAFT